MHYFLVILAAILCAFAYRVRGGAYVSFGSTTVCRLIWALAFQTAYLMEVAYLMIPEFSVGWPQLALSSIGAFCSMYVPHAFCQNMGGWATPQKRWPAFFMPALTQQEWDDFGPVDRELYDAFEMAGVAFFRGLIVFVPLMVFCYFYAPIFEPRNFAIALATITVLQPIAYMVGLVFPWSFTSAMTARTTGWAEFFNGAAWAVALAQL